MTWKTRLTLYLLFVMVLIVPMCLALAAEQSVGSRYALQQAKEEALQAKAKALEAKNKAEKAIASAQRALDAAIREGKPEIASRARELIELNRRKLAEAEAMLKDAENCTLLEKQLESDKDALRRQQKTNEMGLKELEVWTTANQEAQRQALIAGAKVILGHVVSEMEAQSNSARSFQGWLTRYEKQMKKQGVPFEVLQVKIDRAYRGYVNATISAKSGNVLHGGLLGSDLWDLLKNEFGAIGEQKAKSDAVVREALEDPALKLFLENDHAAAELANSLVTIAAQSKELGKVIGPYVELASFVVDYGYEATKWTGSRNRILQQANLTEDNLKAFDALKWQIECTVQKLEDCRAGVAIRECDERTKK